MHKFFLPLVFLFLLSCSNKKNNCTACEKKLKDCYAHSLTYVDLPEEKTESEKIAQHQITAIILENNNYMFEDDETEYTFENYLPILQNKLSESPFKIEVIKIAGHKFAHYEAVFNIIAFCQTNDLNPVLAYDK